MKLNDTSSKKNNKEELKIEFEPFPGDIKNDENKAKLINIGGKTKKNKAIMILTIIIILFLFVFSTLLNQQFLYGSVSDDYNIVNEFDGSYAVIEKENRNDLFKNIGFDYFENKVKYLNNKQYYVTYAYNILPNCDNLTDDISVYYDGNSTVSYIILSLTYKKEDFNVYKATADCNGVLKNFIKMNTPKNAISEVKKNSYYYLNDIKTKTKASYTLRSKLKKYYVLTVIINKGLGN